jgi:hypothetical protein
MKSRRRIEATLGSDHADWWINYSRVLRPEKWLNGLLCEAAKREDAGPQGVICAALPAFQLYPLKADIRSIAGVCRCGPKADISDARQFKKRIRKW